MKFSLFRSGWAPRVGVAVVYAILAFSIVAVVTCPVVSPDEARTRNDSRPTPVDESVSVHIVVDSVQPVSQWTVRNAGEVVEPRWAEATSWEAEFRCAAIDLSVVTTTAADAPTNALRVRLETEARRGDFTFWCPGDCAIMIGSDDFSVSENGSAMP